MLRNFRLYQASIRFYQLCKLVRIAAHSKDELVRASSSVGRNLAEGYGRLAPKDKKRFYRISLGSLRECQIIFEQEEVSDAVLADLADFLGGGLYKLAR